MSEIGTLIRAKTPCIWVTSYEEEAFLDDMRIMLRDAVFSNFNLFTYNIAQGMKKIAIIDTDKDEILEKTVSPGVLFNHIKAAQDVEKGMGNIYILHDAHAIIGQDPIIRALRDLKEYKVKTYCPIIVFSPLVNIPTEMEKLFTVVEYVLPTQAELLKSATAFDQVMGKTNSKYTMQDEKGLEAIAKGCAGLTMKEALSIFARSAVEHKKLSVDMITEQKIQMIKKSGVLDYVVPQVTMQDMGGNTAFKEYVSEVKDAFTAEAKEFGIPAPKGYLSVGLAGTSKTLAAESIASELGVPLIKLNSSKIMDYRVGASEQKAQRAFHIVKSCAPAIFLVDEVEKVFGKFLSFA